MTYIIVFSFINNIIYFYILICLFLIVRYIYIN